LIDSNGSTEQGQYKRGGDGIEVKYHGSYAADTAAGKRHEAAKLNIIMAVKMIMLVPSELDSILEPIPVHLDGIDVTCPAHHRVTVQLSYPTSTIGHRFTVIIRVELFGASRSLNQTTKA